MILIIKKEEEKVAAEVGFHFFWGKKPITLWQAARNIV